MLRKIDWHKKLFFVAIISLFIPGTYFSATRTDINLYVIQQIFYTTLFVFSFAIILSLILKKIIKKNFLHTLSSILLSFFIFFTYSHIEGFTRFLFENIFSVYHVRFSFFITIFLSVIFFILSIKKNDLFINFLAIFFPLILFINITNAINVFINQEELKYSIFSNEEYFNDKQYNKILSQKNNKNIYYVLLDGAITLEEFNNQIERINIDEINKDFDRYKFRNLKNTKSDYLRGYFDSNEIAISEIFNLRRFKNADTLYNLSKNQPVFDTKVVPGNFDKLKTRNVISSAATFPTILTNYDSTALGKTLNKMNYNFYWVGSTETNCIFFNNSICFRDKSGVRNLLKYYLQFRNMYKANYVLRIYFQTTPISKISDKINTKDFFKENYLKNAKYEIDSIKRFLDYSKSKTNNSFTFIHFGLPKINFIYDNFPISFNQDCSLRNIKKRIIKNDLGFHRVQYLNIDEFKDYYASNYYCMLSRLKDFMLFIESFDSDSIVILQAGYNVPIFQNESKRDEYNLLTYVKAPKICQKDLNKGLNNINAVRFLLSCATNKKFNFLEFNKK